MGLISEDYVRQNTWQLSRSDGLISAPVIRFREDGIVGGFLSKWERVWELRDSCIHLQDISGVTSTKLEPVHWDESGVSELRGWSRVFPAVEHVLTRIHMPSLDKVPFSLEIHGEEIRTIRTHSGQRKKNLVILRAGRSSLHWDWARYLNDEDRNWDLCISWFGKDLPENVGVCEYFYAQQKDRKFSAIANLLLKEAHLLGYENFWCPDDDLEVSWRDINRLFNIFRRMNLELAQPALSLGSHSFVNHPVTGQNQDYFLRFCNFVELMCPLFSNALLKLCIPAFRGTTLAFCLDHIWGGLQGRVPGKIAIIDDVAVAHTRPMGANYDPTGTMVEGNELAGLYCIEGSYTMLGGIRRDAYTLL